MAVPSSSLTALSVAIVLGVAPSCERQAKPATHLDRQAGGVTGYDLQKPDTVFTLARSLREISGLATASDSLLLAIQDEAGRVFTLSATTGQIVGESRFASGGDYEAVELVGESVWIVQSDGDLFVRLHGSDKKAERVNTDMKAKHDVEGLAFHPDESVVLLAAKEHLTKARERVIFSLPADDPDKKTAIWATIKIDTVAARLDLDSRSSTRFKPSGLAVHPLTGHTYVVSSALQVLIVLDAQRRLAEVSRLDPDLLPQPEGIAFLPNGDMFIASEGSRRGRLARFTYND